MAQISTRTEQGLAGRRLRALLLTSAIVSAGAAMAMPAFAADAYQPATAPVGLEEVTVTARKTTENLQAVPVSATVLSTVELKQQNLLNFYDLRGAIPDLTVGLSQGGTGVNLSLRGVGAVGALVQTDAKVGLYVDDMYIARPEGNSLMFYDQSNLQVLYGPQGTLFGRNTSGGAVLITTTKPSANGSSYAQVTVGNYSTINAEAGINIPLTDTLFTRFSFRTENSAGYITHVNDSLTSDNINDKSYRGQLRWVPTDKFTADLEYEHDESATNGIASTYRGCSPSGYPASGFGLLQYGGYYGQYGGVYCSLYSTTLGKYQVQGGDIFQGPTSSLKTANYTGGDYTPSGITPFYHGGPFNSVYDNSFILHLTYNLTPDISIKSVTTNRQSKTRDFTSTVDAPYDPYQQYNDQGTKQVSEDLNLTGKAFGSRLHYVAGFYYYNQDTHSLQFDGTDYCDVDGWNDVETNHERSYAVYGQADFDLTPQLQLEVGGRYTKDEKSASGSITAYNEAGSNPACPKVSGQSPSLTAFIAGVAKCATTLSAPGSASWSNFNPMGSIIYKFTPALSAYATIRTSYDQGGFNAHALSYKFFQTNGYNLVPFQPDHFTDYEVGLKTEWFDHTLRVNVDGYYEKYTDYVQTVSVTINKIATRVSQNAGDAHYDGFEGSLEWAPIRDFHLMVNGNIFQAAFDSIYPGNTTTTFNLNTPIVGVAAPAFSYSVSGSYTLHPYKDAMLTVALNYKAQADLLSCQVGANYTCTIPGYGLLGGKADFKLTPDSPWTVSAFATNLTNQYWLIGKTVYNTANPVMGISSDTPGAPREFGMIVKRTF
jgi:iron complex outermembrane receptor protein